MASGYIWEKLKNKSRPKSIMGLLGELTKELDNLLVFGAVFIFGMIVVGEFYGLYTYRTVSAMGWKSPFYYPIYIAILLLLARLIENSGKK